MSEDADRPNPRPEHLDRLSSLWRRIYDRKIAQWSVAYVALAYGVQHGVVLTREAYEWPHAVEEISMLLLTLGLPVVMTFAWYHGERASRRISGPELTIIAILLAIGSMFFYVLVHPAEEASASRAPATQQASVTAARNAAANPNAGVSIAVLPFENLSGDASQEFFSDGMTEEITAALAKIPDLKVVARTSAFQFKSQNRDVQSIGQQLHATHFIEGSVRKAGTRVRVTAQLIKADDATHVWTENYDRELTDVFAIQEDIATAIAGALRTPLGLKQGEHLVSNRTIDADAYQQYLRAKAMVRARGLNSLTDAIALLEQIVARNPDFAPAWGLLALAYDLTPTFHPARVGGSVEEFRRIVNAFVPKAEVAGRRAIQLDASLADGYLSLGHVENDRGKLLSADAYYSKALQLDPNNPDALQGYSLLLAEAGRLKEALAMRQQLLAQEPFVPNFTQNTAMISWLNGQTDAAVTVLEDFPRGDATRGNYLSRIYAAAGRYTDASDLLREYPAANYPGLFTPGAMEEAARLLRTAPAKVASPEKLPKLGNLGFVYLYLGAPDRVLEYYEEALEAGYTVSVAPIYLWHPSYAPVRKLQRFKSFARKIGMVEYWRAKAWPPQCHPTTGDDFACE